MRLMPAASPRLAALLAVVLLVGALLPSAFSIATGLVIAALAAHADLTRPLALLGVIFVLMQVVGPVRSGVADALGRRFKSSVTLRLMGATLLPATIGHLESPEILDHVEAARNPGWVDPRMAAGALVNQLGVRLQGYVAVILLARFEWWVALVVLVGYLIRQRILSGAEHQLFTIWWGKAERLRRADYLRNLSMLPDAAKEVRIFGLADWLIERFERTWLDAMAELWSRRPNLTRYISLASAPMLLSVGLAVAVLTRAALDGAISVAALMVCSQALAVVTRTLGAYSDEDSRVEHGAAGLQPLERLEQTVAGDARLRMAGARPSGGLPQREIRFEGVCFRYPGQTAPVFDGLDLSIPAGRSLGVVGLNGSGKTTLVKLLARLYDPTDGRITVDGIDLRELEPAQWQRRVAALFQDFLCYRFTAADNIAFGAIERRNDLAAIQQAAQRAVAAELIERLPHRWDTVLSRQFTDGVELSGGEWQRVGLARALFAAEAGAGILVLDEPTAHLDVRAEASFYDSFLDLTQGRTTLVISHRFSTVRRADSIVVLAHGRVVERGAHDELLARQGEYARMFELQASRFQDLPEDELEPAS